MPKKRRAHAPVVDEDESSGDDVELHAAPGAALASGGAAAAAAASAEDAPVVVDAEVAAAYSEASEKVGRARRLLQMRKRRAAAEEARLEALKREITMDEHTLPVEELCERLGTDATRGLTTAEHQKRLAEQGPNRLTPPRSTPWFVKFLSQFLQVFSLLLLFGGALCFVSYAVQPTNTENLGLGIVLLLVVFLTACFSHYQEAQASKAMDGFKKLAPDFATVVRDGEPLKVGAEQLVIGDVVEVRGGDKIPADLRLIDTNSLKVNNSSLTGEAEPQSRAADMTDDNPLETKNLAWYTSFATEGTGRAVVIRTGDETMIGRIAAAVTGQKSPPTPIRRELTHFIHIISAVALVLGVTFFFVSIARRASPVDTLVFVIGIIVANVPEGLLATVTVSLTLTAKRMAAKAVLVKNLESVETLGSTSTICSDKTGTLTQNRMTVAHFWYDDAIYSHSVGSPDSFSLEAPSCRALLRVAGLCNRARFSEVENAGELPVQVWPTIGDASESALIKWVHTQRDIVEMRDANPKLAEVPFNSTNKYQLSVHETEDPDDPRLLLVIKGAPERIVRRSTRILVNGVRKKLTRHYRERFLAAYDDLGSRGERVLGFAHLYLDAATYTPDYEFDIDAMNFPADGLTFVGLVSLIDPPREAVPYAVRTCQAAGIQVIMVTGDYPTTAAAIARQVNIIRDDTAADVAKREGVAVEDVDPASVKAVVVHGDQLRDMTEAELDAVLEYDQIVFARTSPQQKLRIVEGCQRRGDVVAVTGDGVNDSPALKKADIGVAMGITGSDVSKDAADMILMDDNFASIVNGVEEGRLIFDNLKKSIAYTLSSNIPEITPFIFFILLDIPLALTTAMILAIDLGTDMVPAISLAYETAESDIMARRPRNAQTDKLVTKKLISFSYLQIGIIQALAGFFVWTVVLADNGVYPQYLLGTGPTFDTRLLPLVDARYENEPQAAFDARVATWADVQGAAVPDGLDVTAYGFSQLSVWFGQAFLSFPERVIALRRAQTTFLVSIVQVQWSDLLICKTRKLSLLQQGMRNPVLWAGLISETLLIVCLVYIPVLQSIFFTTSIPFVYWLLALPFSALILAYDELRKFLMRRSPGSWIERHTYY